MLIRVQTKAGLWPSSVFSSVHALFFIFFISSPTSNLFVFACIYTNIIIIIKTAKTCSPLFSSPFYFVLLTFFLFPFFVTFVFTIVFLLFVSHYQAFLIFISIFSFIFIIIIILFLSCLQNKSHLDPQSNYTKYSYHISISYLTYYLPQSATVDWSGCGWPYKEEEMCWKDRREWGRESEVIIAATRSMKWLGHTTRSVWVQKLLQKLQANSLMYE